VAGLDFNAGMLDVARTVKAPAEPPIRWYESPAESMPLPDGAFDVVLCQLGLQFIADKVAALREMRRVTATGGRVLVNTPAPSPFQDVLEDALARRIPNAAAFMHVVFSLHDRAAIERLFRDAGFDHAAVEPYTRRLTLPAPRDFLWQYVQGTPIAGLIADADHSLLEGLEREVIEGWQPWVADGGLAYEQQIVVTTARRS
jgi:SAM-dependent methyltransferase